MLVRPMLDGWQLPRIESIRAEDSRRHALLGAIGLQGDLYQDLGRAALTVVIEGSLSSDEARDEFLTELRSRYEAGAPVDFVADITKDTELEQVVVVRFEVQERAGQPDWFRYRLVLREYTEPPPPPGFGDDFGLELDTDLGLDALAGLDLLDLPGLLADLPKLDDMLAPAEQAAEKLGGALSEVGGLFGPLLDALGDEP